MEGFRGYAVDRRHMLAVAATVSAAALGGCAPATRDGSTAPSGAAGPSSSAPLADGPSLSADPAPASPKDVLARMTLEQKVGQLFMVRPEQLAGEEGGLAATRGFADALERVPVGGLCLFSQNMESAQQVEDFLSAAPACWQRAGIPVGPLLAVDEEGGDLVARVANSGLFNVERVPNMGEIGAAGDPDRARRAGEVIGGYLRDIGFNVDFAPVADVLTNPDNPVIGARSFGGDPVMVGKMVAAQVDALMEQGILPCAKHFPGHGDTREDSHTGAAVTDRTEEELRACEYVPFQRAIEAGCPMVMVGHIQVPRVTGDDVPASLSPRMIDGVLRQNLGFDGVVVADSFEMGAITQACDAGQAAVRFIRAGGDLVLLPVDLEQAYRGVLDAVRSGEISCERIDQSVLRVLDVKKRAGLFG